MLRRALALFALAAASAASGQQRPLVLATPGPAPAGPLLARALAGPYVRRYEKWNTRLFRDSVFDRTVIVVGSDASVAATVHGDVIVIDGDLFLQPGAAIDGSAVALGGCVYDSQQATVGAERVCLRDARYDVRAGPDADTLLYHPPPPGPRPEIITLPLLFGLRLPAYDRVDGLALPWGPRFTLPDGSALLDALVTYRSDLGAWDPSATLRDSIGGGWTIEASGGRGTLTNERWIQSDGANSVSVFFRGHDYRNYWRAVRFEGRLAKHWTGNTTAAALWAGGRTERDRSVLAGGPWSVFDRTDSDAILRPNPAIEAGRLTSALGGGSVEWNGASITLRARTEVEQVFDGPNGEHLTQATTDLGVGFPTFTTPLGTQTVEVRTHIVITGGDSTPPQRFTYVGGSGTLPTFPVLAFGGDRVVFVEARYNIPIETIRLPFFQKGPVITLREMLASAGVRRLPRFDSNLGVRLTVSFFRADAFVNPDNGDTAFSVGLAILR